MKRSLISRYLIYRYKASHSYFLFRTRHFYRHQVLQQLEEEELMEECLEAMLEEERQHQRNMSSTAWSTATGTSDNNAAELCQQLSSLRMQDDLAKQVPEEMFLFF